MDLKELLGEELYNQVIEKAGDNKLDIVNNGNWIPKDKFNAVNEQLKTANTTITDLKKSNKDNEELQTKVGEYETKVTNYEKQIQDMQFNYALEGAIKGANARNIKAIKALLNLDNIKLDGEKILGLTEQLEEIKKSDSYLFEEQQQTKFSGVEPVNNTVTKTTPKDTSKMSYIELCKYMEENPNSQI